MVRWYELGGGKGGANGDGGGGSTNGGRGIGDLVNTAANLGVKLRAAQMVGGGDERLEMATVVTKVVRTVAKAEVLEIL